MCCRARGVTTNIGSRPPEERRFPPGLRVQSGITRPFCSRIDGTSFEPNAGMETSTFRLLVGEATVTPKSSSIADGTRSRPRPQCLRPTGKTDLEAEAATRTLKLSRNRGPADEKRTPVLVLVKSVAATPCHAEGPGAPGVLQPRTALRDVSADASQAESVLPFLR